MALEDNTMAFASEMELQSKEAARQYEERKREKEDPAQAQARVLEAALQVELDVMQKKQYQKIEEQKAAIGKQRKAVKQVHGIRGKQFETKALLLLRQIGDSNHKL